MSASKSGSVPSSPSELRSRRHRIFIQKAPQLIELQGFNSRGMAERTGLEPATSNVTGWRSNQLSYRSIPVRVARKLGDDPCRCNTYFCEK